MGEFVSQTVDSTFITHDVKVGQESRLESHRKVNHKDKALCPNTIFACKEGRKSFEDGKQIIKNEVKAFLQLDF